MSSIHKLSVTQDYYLVQMGAAAAKNSKLYVGFNIGLVYSLHISNYELNWAQFLKIVLNSNYTVPIKSGYFYTNRRIFKLVKKSTLHKPNGYPPIKSISL